MTREEMFDLEAANKLTIKPEDVNIRVEVDGKPIISTHKTESKEQIRILFDQMVAQLKKIEA